MNVDGQFIRASKTSYKPISVAMDPANKALVEGLMEQNQKLLDDHTDAVCEPLGTNTDEWGQKCNGILGGFLEGITRSMSEGVVRYSGLPGVNGERPQF